MRAVVAALALATACEASEDRVRDAGVMTPVLPVWSPCEGPAPTPAERCSVQVFAQARSGLAVDETCLYFSDNEDFYRIAKLGGTPELLGWTYGWFEGPIVLDEDAIWAGANSEILGYRLVTVPRYPGANPRYRRKGALDYAIDGAYVYYGTGGCVVRSPKISDLEYRVACHGGTPNSIAVDDEYVYWSTYYWPSGSPEVLRAPKEPAAGSGAAGELLVTFVGARWAGSLLINEDTLFILVQWDDKKGDTDLYALSLSSGRLEQRATRTNIASLIPYPPWLFVTEVGPATQINGSLSRMPLSGGPLEYLADLPDEIPGYAVADSEAIYISVGGWRPSQILRVPYDCQQQP